MKYYQIKIRELREDNDLTQKDIANYLGIEQTVYSRYETGRNELSIENLIKLCKFYNVASDYILGLPRNTTWPR